MNSYNHEKLIKKFDPNGVGKRGNLFGLPFDAETSKVIVIPVPWDVTASFHDGTSQGPGRVLDVSSQIDLFLLRMPEAWKLGVSMLPVSDEWINSNNEARKYAIQYIRSLEGEDIKLTPEEEKLILRNINALSDNINDWVYKKSMDILKKDKIPVVLGGDHSSPYGLMKAMSEHHGEFGVLQIDAHADLRPAYQGFVHSHASIMHNLLKFNNVTTLVQVGVRDFCHQEFEVMESDSRIITFYDRVLAKEQFEGKPWSTQVSEIVDCLPEHIYITLDIDGLSHDYSPETGTPVPGGISYNQLLYLFDKIVESGKQVIAFDLCEISARNGDWDAIVGARVLYYLIGVTGASQGLVPFK